MADPLPAEWLALWVLFLLFALVGRRDRRLLYRLPALGAAVALLTAAGLLGGSALLRSPPGPSVRAIIVALAGVFAGGCAIPSLLCWLRAGTRLDLPRWRRALRPNRWTLGCLALGLLAAGTSFGLGRAVVARWPYRDDVTLFETDAPVYFRYLTGTAAGEHPITHKHPLYLLFAQPPYRLAAAVLAPPHAALVPAALASAAALLLAAGYFRAVTGSSALALLLAATLGASTAHTVFGALPETYAPSAAGLILLHWLLARRSAARVRLRHEVPAAALAIGTTATHVVTAAVCFFSGRLHGLRRRVTVRWAASVVTLLCFLLVLQQALIPAAATAPAGALRGEARYLRPEGNLAGATVNVLRGFLADNVVAPGLTVRPDTEGHRGLHLGPHPSWWSRATLAAWWLALASAVGLILTRTAARRPTLWAALICLLATAGLHLFYGNAHVFLFSCTFTFYLFAIVAHGWRTLPRRRATLAAAALALLVTANTARFWGQLFDVLGALPAPP